MNISNQSLTLSASNLSNKIKQFQPNKLKTLNSKQKSDLFIRNLTNIQQRLFTAQSIISENQLQKNIMIDIKNELMSINKGFISKNYNKTFEQILSKLGQNARQMLNSRLVKPFKTFLLSEKNLELFLDVIKSEIRNIEKNIELEKSNIVKLQISNENINASNISTSREMKKIVSILNKVQGLEIHKMSNHDNVSELITDKV